MRGVTWQGRHQKSDRQSGMHGYQEYKDHAGMHEMLGHLGSLRAVWAAASLYGRHDMLRGVTWSGDDHYSERHTVTGLCRLP